MRYFLIIFLGLFLSFPAFAGQLEDGQAAYKKHDYQTALKLLEPLADEGNGIAQFELGMMYGFGEGVEIDHVKAKKLSHEAFKNLPALADQGNPEAAYDLGYIYSEFIGNDAEAFKWYRNAAKGGNIYAQYALGEWYSYGRGVQRSFEEAFKWYQKAAEQGEYNSQIQLGQMYEYGRGVKKNSAEATKWFKKAEIQSCAASYGQSSPPESSAIRYEAWDRSDIVGLRIALDDPKRVEEMDFRDDGEVFMSIGSKDVSAAPAFNWQLTNGRIQIYDGSKNNVKYALTLVARKPESIVVLNLCNRLVTYKILRSPTKSTEEVKH